MSSVRIASKLGQKTKKADSSAEQKLLWLVGTGGTIAGTGASSTSSSYEAGKLHVSALTENNPDLKKFKIESTNLFNIDSSDITLDHWLKLAAHINELLEGDVQGVVVTHGTDTLEETAYFLHLVIKSNKPVVLVGSMRPSTSSSPDGPINLFNAFSVANSPEAGGKGVLVLMNDEIFSARDVTKSNTTKVNAFNSPNNGPLGRVHCGKVQFNSNITHQHTSDTPFKLEPGQTLPNVEILLEYAGSTPAVLKAMINLDPLPDAIVIAGLGNGGIPKTHQPYIDEAKKKGIIIVVCSRVGSGSVILDELDCPNKEHIKNIAGEDLSPQKARILLMLAIMYIRATKEYAADPQQVAEKLTKCFNKY
ncbi:MAG: asparaginase [Gammaproteobacteria bacterium]